MTRGTRTAPQRAAHAAKQAAWYRTTLEDLIAMRDAHIANGDVPPAVLTDRIRQLSPPANASDMIAAAQKISSEIQERTARGEVVSAKLLNRMRVAMIRAKALDDVPLKQRHRLVLQQSASRRGARL